VSQENAWGLNSNHASAEFCELVGGLLGDALATAMVRLAYNTHIPAAMRQCP